MEESTNNIIFEVISEDGTIQEAHNSEEVQILLNLPVLDQGNEEHVIIINNPERHVLDEISVLPNSEIQNQDNNAGNNNNNNNIGFEVNKFSNSNLEEINDDPDYVDEAENNTTIDSEEKIKVRKRIRKSFQWKCIERKKKHQAGLEYVSRRNKLIHKKQIKNKKDCLNHCKYKCLTKMTDKERKEQFKSFYKLDSNGKHHFINTTTERINKHRKTKKEDDPPSRRKFSFKYYFFVNNSKIQVCKTFYLSTLDISQKPVYNVHCNKDPVTNVPKDDMRGKSKNKNVVSEDRKQVVRDHINSFATVESHYCRAKTARKYLEANLNISKMYDLYVAYCQEKKIEPVKMHLYRHLFVSEFNIGFHKPKSDRCGTCEKYLVMKNENALSEDDLQMYNDHIQLKEAMRAEKKRYKEQHKTPLLCFDLQNVITCPKTDIGPLFYKSKLNIYNLTAHLSTMKVVYCCLWTEFTSGRSGNDIASAFIKILKRVFEDTEFTELVTWSDSCVPQNRNSIIAYAVQNFMNEHPDIKSITMKYSVPGHSCIQEVDHAHSMIEKTFRKAEFYSPMGVIRLLKTVNRSRPYVILQMKDSDFKDFSSCAQDFPYKVIPFASVTMLKFSQNNFLLKYKTTYNSNDEFTEKNIKPRSLKNLRQLKPLAIKNEVSEEKKSHFLFMMPYMPENDKTYFRNILKLDANDIKENQSTKRKSTAEEEIINKKKRGPKTNKKNQSKKKF